MWSTEPEELTLIPRLEFADGVSKVSQLLSIYPKDQTTKDQIPFSADTVRLKNYVYLFRELQAAGDLSDGNLGHASVSSNTLKVRCKRYARLISERSATSGQLQSKHHSLQHDITGHWLRCLGLGGDPGCRRV